MRALITMVTTLGLLALPGLPAHAQTIYKCTVDGKISYGQSPCAGGQTLEVPAAPPESANAGAELARQQRLSQQLERERHRKEAREAREDQRQDRAAALHQRQCAKLTQNRKWADEDARRAGAGQADAARLKARRAAEQLALECPR